MSNKQLHCPRCPSNADKFTCRTNADIYYNVEPNGNIDFSCIEEIFYTDESYYECGNCGEDVLLANSVSEVERAHPNE